MLITDVNPNARHHDIILNVCGCVAVNTAGHRVQTKGFFSARYCYEVKDEATEYISGPIAAMPEPFLSGSLVYSLSRLVVRIVLSTRST